MSKYYLRNFFRGILLNLPYLIIILLIFPILLPFGVGILPLMIATIVIACIIYIILLVMYSRNSNFTAFVFGVDKELRLIRKYDVDNYKSGEHQKILHDKHIIQRAVSKKPIKAVWAYIWLSIHLIIAIVCGVFTAILIFKGASSDLSIWSIFTLHIAIFQFIYFMVRLVFYIRATCFKCGNIFCKVEVDSDLKTYRSKWQQDRKTSENVGSIYADGQKICDVYKEGTTTDNYMGISTYITYKCKCLYCGKQSVQKSEFHDSFKIK